ncbi:MAG TPA: diguanylate cyclase [Geminicoccus sp.]|jgi:diguanylate cyclase (GGDEF)-like protein/PAS domain S-box-containing protein|uniref:diguanylate cyclase domain-containing protein n=1 Tax=Geminicoccus sp. TaxID=2024832 RepID=UPI002E30595E|nr:diguanylate cyclase [Geminicoccus sp.]HEX2528179.1 diguanylate cyclase [Geminicoccus sp.]
MEAEAEAEPASRSAHQRYAGLGEALGKNIQQVIRLVTFAFDVPQATVVLVDSDYAWTAWFHGDAGQFSVDRSASFCGRVIHEGRPVVIADARHDPRHACHPLIDRDDPLFFYAGVPLVLHNGELIGSLGIHDRRSQVVSDEQLAALEDFAALVVRNLELQRQACAQAELEAQVEAERGRLGRIIDSLPFDLWLSDIDGRYILQNKVGRELWGSNLGKRPSEIGIPPEIAVQWTDTNRRVLAGETIRGEFCYEAGGRRLQLEEIISPLRDEDSRVEGVVGVSIDISERKRAETARRESDARLKAAVEALPFDFWTCGPDGTYLMINSTAREHWGDVQGKNPANLDLDPEIKAHWLEKNRLALSGKRLRHEATYGTPDQPRHVDVIMAPVEMDNRIIGLVGVNVDITERKLAEQRLAHLAHHDPVTGLANRRLFHERLTETVSRSHRQGYTSALLLLDLDGFKEVNDTIGHDGGDALLVEVASRLKTGRRVTDLVARLGGDEFAVILEAVRQPADAAEIATQILTMLQHPFRFEGNEVRPQASIGIAIYPTDGGGSASGLLKHADIALYRAKRDGRGHWRFVDEEMRSRTEKRRERTADLFADPRSGPLPGLSPSS